MNMKKLNGCYRARVENNGRDTNFEGNDPVADPDGRFRVQVRVYGVHTFNSGDKQFIEQPDGNNDDIIPLKHLPWAEQCTTLLFNQKSSKNENTGLLEPGGVFCTPSVGAWVWVFFEQGDPMSPIYFGGMMPNSAVAPILSLKPARTRIETKAGHIIEIDDALDADGQPDGCIVIKFISVLGSSDEADMSIVSLRKDSISIKAKSISIAASENLTMTGPTSATLNNNPIVTSYAPTPALESLNMGK